MNGKIEGIIVALRSNGVECPWGVSLLICQWDEVCPLRMSESPQSQGEWNRPEVVKEVEYMGSTVCTSNQKETDVSHRLSERKRMISMGCLQRSRALSFAPKVGILESLVSFYPETWVFKARERRRVEKVDMKCLKGGWGLQQGMSWRRLGDQIRL